MPVVYDKLRKSKLFKRLLCTKKTFVKSKCNFEAYSIKYKEPNEIQTISCSYEY